MWEGISGVHGFELSDALYLMICGMSRQHQINVSRHTESWWPSGFVIRLRVFILMFLFVIKSAAC